MLKSIYTPVTGANAQERVMEIIANNLANVNTTGYKKDGVTFTLLEPEPYKNYKNPLPPANYKQSLEDFMPLRGNEISYVGTAGVSRDWSQGPAMRTDNSTDVMIEGDGFLGVMTEEGMRLTRDGSLTMNSDGVLVTKAGHAVMGEKGDILLSGGDFNINGQGEIFQNGKLVDRLVVYSPKDPASLERVGMNYYFHGGEPEGLMVLENPSVRQGFLEGSNVNAIKDMTNMIMAHRFFEAYQKTIANYDSMMDKSSNSIGTVRA